MNALLITVVTKSIEIVEMYCNKVMRTSKIKNPYKDRDLYIGI